MKAGMIKIVIRHDAVISVCLLMYNCKGFKFQVLHDNFKIKYHAFKAFNLNKFWKFHAIQGYPFEPCSWLQIIYSQHCERALSNNKVFYFLTHSLQNFWHPFSRSVRNYFVDARKNHGYGYKNWYISVTNIARHKICTSLDL